MSQEKVRQWRPNLVTDFTGHWKRALRNEIVSWDGMIYQIRSGRGGRVHVVELEKRSCTCKYATYHLPHHIDDVEIPNFDRSGCSHIVTASIHWGNQHGYRVQLAPTYVYRYRADAPGGKGDADGQYLLGHGIKILMYQIPEGHRINQLNGMEEPIPYDPDTTEDIPDLEERLAQVIKVDGEKSVEAVRLQIRINVVKRFGGSEPIDTSAVQSKVEDEPFTELDVSDEPIEEPGEPDDSPKWYGRDYRPYAWAKSYLNAGFSVGKLKSSFPVPKYPVISWKQYMSEPPTEDQVDKWWGRDDQDGRMCIFTGYGGLYVFDFDESELYDMWMILIERVLDTHDRSEYKGVLKQLGVVRTGGGGYHVYVRTENPPPGNLVLAEKYEWESEGVPKRAPDAGGAMRIVRKRTIDGRGSGGLVVAPPSAHESGNRYEWLSDFDKIPVVEQALFEIMLLAAQKFDDSERVKVDDES